MVGSDTRSSSPGWSPIDVALSNRGLCFFFYKGKEGLSF